MHQHQKPVTEKDRIYYSLSYNVLEIFKRASGKNYHSYSDSTLHVRKNMESVSSSYSMKLLPWYLSQKSTSDYNTKNNNKTKS